MAVQLTIQVTQVYIFIRRGGTESEETAGSLRVMTHNKIVSP